MKKTLLSIGTLSAIVAPVASVIACGDGDVPGHEAPYSISIQTDDHIPTQANVEIKLKGYVSDSYIKEIKSRIAESIVAANKDTLKYSTIKILVGSITIPIYIRSIDKLISTSPLTNANKNDLDAIHNFIDSAFDDLINSLKSSKEFLGYFKKENWENMHHQIDKLDQDEVKLKLLKLFGFENITNPDVINFEYEVISDKYINVAITRTNVDTSTELIQNIFSTANTGYEPFLEGEKMNISINFNSKNIYDNKTLDLINDIYVVLWKPNVPRISKYGSMGTGGAKGNRDAPTQLYKIAKYLLKANGYSDDIVFTDIYSASKPTMADDLKTLGNSINKVFTYGDNGQTVGINYDDGSIPRIKITRHFQFDFDKKTFGIKYDLIPYDEKQWIFGKNGDHLIIEPSHKWSIEIEGTYEIDHAGDRVGAITGLTKAIASDGTNTIDILESSAKLIAMSSLKERYWFFNGW